MNQTCVAHKIKTGVSFVNLITMITRKKIFSKFKNAKISQYV